MVEVETRISRYLEVERPDAIKTIFINLGDREITRGSVNINTECYLFRMLSMYFISLCFMALYENALNQTGFKCGKPTMQTASLLISYGLMITLTSYLGLLLFRKISG